MIETPTENPRDTPAAREARRVQIARGWLRHEVKKAAEYALLTDIQLADELIAMASAIRGIDYAHGTAS